MKQIYSIFLVMAVAGCSAVVDSEHTETSHTETKPRYKSSVINPFSIERLPKYRVGSRWVYRKRAWGKSLESVVEVLGEERIQNGSRFQVLETKQGMQTYSQVWEEDSFLKQRVMSGSLIQFNPEKWLIQVPLSVGMEWQNTIEENVSVFEVKRVRSVRVIGAERITVEAGTFDTLKMQIGESSESFDKNSGVEWWNEEIGLVMHTCDGLWELVEFSAR